MMKLPVPTNGSMMWTPESESRSVELGLENLLNTSHHEISDRLWRVDDAVCVREFDRVALKKRLVNGVEKLLFVVVVVNCAGGSLHCGIEGGKAFEIFIAVESVFCEYLDHLFNLAGDDIATDEILIIEDLMEDALGKEMLDEHLLNGGFGEVWVDRLTAKLVKLGKSVGKRRCVQPCVPDVFSQAFTQFGHFFSELDDCPLPFVIFCCMVGKEGIENLYQLGWVGQIGIAHLMTVLPKG